MWRGVLRSLHVVPLKWVFWRWALECEEVMEGSLVCCTRMWVFLNLLTRNPYRVRTTSFLRYQMLWNDTMIKQTFFNICSCLLQIAYFLQICSTNSKSWIPESKKQNKKIQKWNQLFSSKDFRLYLSDVHLKYYYCSIYK